MKKILRSYEVCGRTRWNIINYSNDANDCLRFLYFCRLRNNCLVLSDDDLMSRASAHILAKLSIETLYTSGVSSCIVERMVVHDTIWNSSTEFLYVPCSWDRRSTFARKLRGGGRENRWEIKRMSRFRKQFLRNISCLDEEDKTAVSEICNSERWTFSRFTVVLCPTRRCYKSVIFF